MKKITIEFTERELADLQYALVHSEVGWKKNNHTFESEEWMTNLLRKIDAALNVEVHTS